MDAKVTLSFDKEVIKKAKALAEAHNTSLSRFLEYLLRKATSGNYRELIVFEYGHALPVLTLGEIQEDPSASIHLILLELKPIRLFEEYI